MHNNRNTSIAGHVGYGCITSVIRYDTYMNESCPIRTVETRFWTEKITEAYTPRQCVDCLSRALAGHIPSTITSSAESYQAAVDDMKSIDEQFDPESADTYGNTLFARPAFGPKRNVLMERGFEIDTQEGPIISSETIEFSCPNDQS
jgi:hypothetical protein